MGLVLSYCDFAVKGGKKNLFLSLSKKKETLGKQYQSPQYYWQGSLDSSSSGLQISFLLNGWNAGEGKGREPPTFSLSNKEPQRENHSPAEVICD